MALFCALVLLPVISELVGEFVLLAEPAELLPKALPLLEPWDVALLCALVLLPVICELVDEFVLLAES